MKQASTMMEATESAPGRHEGRGLLQLATCSAAIDHGLLLVFGPDGDPLPPEVFGETAAAQPTATIMIDGAAVPVTRVAVVLRAQRDQRLAPLDGAAWIRSMLGLGPQPDEARLDELAAEGRSELIRFGQELVFTNPVREVLVLRAARPDDGEPGVQVQDSSGAPLDHEALLEFVDPGPADDDQAVTVTGQLDAGDLLLAFQNGRIRLAPAAADQPRTLPCRPAGEAVDWPTLVRMLLGTPPAPAGEAEHDEAHEPAGRPGDSAQHGCPATPERLVFDEHGFIDLGWLEESLQASGGGSAPIVVSGLPPSVRLSAGEPSGGVWRVERTELTGLAMFATPEDLTSFTVLIQPDAPDADGWSIPVVPRAGVEVSPEEPLSIALDFPPPFSARNRLDYFAVLMVEGLPEGAALSAGVPSGRGRWTLSAEDLRGLRAHLPAGVTLPRPVDIVGVTIENRDGKLSSVRRTCLMGADPETSAEPSRAVAAELDLSPLLDAAGPGRRVDAVALAGVPPVVELSQGTYDRVSNCWVLRSSQLSGVALTVRDPAIRSLSLKARAIAIDRSGASTAIAQTLEIEVPDAATTELEPVSSGAGFFRGLAERRG